MKITSSLDLYSADQKNLQTAWRIYGKYNFYRLLLQYNQETGLHQLNNFIAKGYWIFSFSQLKEPGEIDIRYGE